MFQKRSTGNLSLLVLLVLLTAALAACNPGSTPTATPVAEPTATVEAPAAAPTDTALPPTQPPTETAAPPTPTEAIAETPTTAPVGDLAWKQVGLAGKTVQSIAAPPSGGSIAVAAGPDGAWSSASDFTQWEQLPVRVQGRTTSAAMGGPNVIYVTGHNGCLSGAPMTLQRSTDGGKTWKPTTGDGAPFIVVAPDEKLAYGTTCGGIVKTTDAGATWAELPGSKITNYDPGALAAGPDGKTIFAASYSEGGTARITRSTDAGATWIEVTPKEQEMRAPVLLSVVPGPQGHPEQAGAYMASAPGLLWFLPEGSNDWKLTKKDDPKLDRSSEAYEITALYVDTSYTQGSGKPGPVVYTARALQVEGKMQGLGVFRSLDGGVTWEAAGKGLGQRAVNSLVLAPHNPLVAAQLPDTLLAGTDDGVWALTMPGGR